MMKITRKDPISGETNTKILPISQEQFDSWQKGALIQNAMPHLSEDDREFLMTGITKESWDSMFGKE